MGSGEWGRRKGKGKGVKGNGAKLRAKGRTPPPTPPRTRGGEVLAQAKTGVGFRGILTVLWMQTIPTVPVTNRKPSSRKQAC